MGKVTGDKTGAQSQVSGPRGCLTTPPCLQSLPVGQLNATQRGGAITAHEQPKVTVCGDTREDRG